MSKKTDRPSISSINSANSLTESNKIEISSSNLIINIKQNNNNNISNSSFNKLLSLQKLIEKQAHLKNLCNLYYIYYYMYMYSYTREKENDGRNKY